VGSTLKTATSPKIVNGAQNVGSITISGQYIAGQTLTATPGAGWSSGASLRFQWLKDGKAIRGATSDFYNLPLNFEGHRISLKVTAKKPGYDDAFGTTARTLIG
jgi:hypothetical protein